jgi:hypothetical protein
MGFRHTYARAAHGYETTFHDAALSAAYIKEAIHPNCKYDMQNAPHCQPVLAHLPDGAMLVGVAHYIAADNSGRAGFVQENEIFDAAQAVQIMREIVLLRETLAALAGEAGVPCEIVDFYSALPEYARHAARWHGASPQAAEHFPQEFSDYICKHMKSMTMAKMLGASRFWRARLPQQGDAIAQAEGEWLAARLKTLSRRDYAALPQAFLWQGAKSAHPRAFVLASIAKRAATLEIIDSRYFLGSYFLSEGERDILCDIIGDKIGGDSA